MASEAAGTGGRLKLPSLRLPERLPDLRRPWLTLFEIFWFAALLLAIAGPIAGLYYRFTTPGENSALMLGSRTGLVLSRRRSHLCPLSDRRSGQGRGCPARRPYRRDRWHPTVEGRAAEPFRDAPGNGHRLRSVRASHPKQRAGRARPHVALAQGRNAQPQGPYQRGADRAGRARGRTDADFARGRRPAAHRHLPVPAVRGVDPSPAQARRPDQLGPVAGDSADDRFGAAVRGLPELHCPRSRMDPPAPLRPRQYVPARRNPAVPVRPVETARVSTVPGRVADPLLPVGRRLPGNLRNIHDRRRADAHVAAPEHPAERGQTANQMGAAGFLRLRLLPRARFPQRHDQAEYSIVRRAADARGGRGPELRPRLPQPATRTDDRFAEVQAVRRRNPRSAGPPTSR